MLYSMFHPVKEELEDQRSLREFIEEVSERMGDLDVYLITHWNGEQSPTHVGVAPMVLNHIEDTEISGVQKIVPTPQTYHINFRDYTAVVIKHSETRYHW